MENLYLIKLILQQKMADRKENTIFLVLFLGF